MKNCNGRFYVDVKYKPYSFHPNEEIFLREREPSKTLETQHRVQNEREIRKNLKVITKDIDKLEVRPHSETKKKNQKFKFLLLACPSCIENNWIEFSKAWCCQIYDFINNIQNYQKK